ncbi:MAG: type II toxin-antitoxin system HicB family antitoxin [Treponema sp.]|nr:type II toxin-antitoxin system HicB family antitoxin [Treponema sp.]
MEMPYTYWEGEDNWLVGYLNDYPDHWTQGKNIPELEEMLMDLYINFQEEARNGKKPIKKSGVLRIPA